VSGGPFLLLSSQHNLKATPMGVLCKPINVILNLESVDKKYPGGRKLLLLDFSLSVGNTHCFDDYLYRISVNTLEEANKMVRYFRSLGLIAEEKIVKDKHIWTGDLCIINTEEALTDCNWLTYDKDTNVAKHYKDTTKEIISEENVLERFKEKTKLKKENTFKLLTQYLKQEYLQVSFRKNYWEYLFLLIHYKKETQPKIPTKLLFFSYFILWNDYVAFFLAGFMAYILGWYYFFIVLLIYLLINRLVFNNIGKFFLARQIFHEIKLFEELLDNEMIAITTTMKYKSPKEYVPFVVIKSSDWDRELNKAIKSDFLPNISEEEIPEKTQSSESVGLADHLFPEMRGHSEEEFIATVENASKRNHTSFVYSLKDLAFENHAVLGGLLLESLDNKGDNPLKEFWEKLGESDSKNEEVTFIPEIVNIKPNKNIFILRLPSVQLPTEALFVGFYLDDPSDIRVYTLEFMQSNEYALCMWNEISHNLIETGVKPDLEEFIQAISRNFDRREIKGRYICKE
jgi:hypothetical protein